MNEEILDKLFEYIDARIDQKLEDTSTSSDSGINAMIMTAAIKEELIKLVQNSK